MSNRSLLFECEVTVWKSPWSRKYTVTAASSLSHQTLESAPILKDHLFKEALAFDCK